MDSSFFKKSIPRNLGMKAWKELEVECEDDEFEKLSKENTPATMNAFHLISLSEGFDLSPLFSEKKEEKGEMRFATAKPTSSVISRLEEVAVAEKFTVKKSETMVKLQKRESGRKGKLAIAAEIYAVSPSLAVVEVKKNNGDTLEYNQFCNKELRPALKDIAWTSPLDSPTQSDLE